MGCAERERYLILGDNIIVRRMAVAGCALGMLLAMAVPAFAQINRRLLLATGDQVAGHGGLTFGPFLSLAMNGNQEIIFLTTLHSARADVRAVVRSAGVSFSVVAFQGLVGPFPRSTYDSFSAPSMNDAGVAAFSATLDTDQDTVPKSVVVRLEGGKPRVVSSTLDAPPSQPDSKFEEFSAPLVSSAGDVLFAARWSGKTSGCGLFLWTAHGLQAIRLPAALELGPQDLLDPFFVGRDEAAFVRRGVSADIAAEQFFRAIAIRSWQDLQPAPDPTAATELLAPRPGASSVQMLLVSFAGGALQAALLSGDPSKAVMVKQSPTASPLKPVDRILSVTLGPQGNMVFAAAHSDTPNDIALYCDCDGQANRLTTPEDVLPVSAALPGKPILSLTGDTQQTFAFIGPTAKGDNTAIYVTTFP